MGQSLLRFDRFGIDLNICLRDSGHSFPVSNSFTSPPKYEAMAYLNSRFTYTKAGRVDVVIRRKAERSE